MPCPVCSDLHIASAKTYLTCSVSIIRQIKHPSRSDRIGKLPPGVVSEDRLAAARRANSSPQMTATYRQVYTRMGFSPGEVHRRIAGIKDEDSLELENILAAANAPEGTSGERM